MAVVPLLARSLRQRAMRASPTRSPRLALRWRPPPISARMRGRQVHRLADPLRFRHRRHRLFGRPLINQLIERGHAVRALAMPIIAAQHHRPCASSVMRSIHRPMPQTSHRPTRWCIWSAPRTRVRPRHASFATSISSRCARPPKQRCVRAYPISFISAWPIRRPSCRPTSPCVRKEKHWFGQPGYPQRYCDPGTSSGRTIDGRYCSSRFMRCLKYYRRRAMRHGGWPRDTRRDGGSARPRGRTSARAAPDLRRARDTGMTRRGRRWALVAIGAFVALAVRDRVLSPCELRLVHSRLPWLRQEHLCARTRNAARRRWAVKSPPIGPWVAPRTAPA